MHGVDKDVARYVESGLARGKELIEGMIRRDLHVRDIIAKERRELLGSMKGAGRSSSVVVRRWSSSPRRARIVDSRV